MELKIIWSQFAETQLDKIFDYYHDKAGYRVATKILKQIINEPQKLLKNPEIGQIEELLLHRNIKYHYFVFKNYKLIYSIDKENNFIKIADVFDTRQNPSKINRSK